SVRSKPVPSGLGAPAPFSVLVVVAMVVLQRVDADEPAVRIAREEEVAVEVADHEALVARALVRRADVHDAEPHDDADLRSDLLGRLPVGRIVDDDLRVRCVEPSRVIARVAGQAHDLAIEALDLAPARAEQHHRTDLRPVLTAHAVAPDAYV